QLSSYDAALATAVAALQNAEPRTSAVCTSNERFNAWINRSVSDLQMMITDTASGPDPYAGVPCFSTPFGRDGILTALECLWLYPSMARGVLAFLAATQATEINAE